jgi:hypothetical protein
MHTQYPKIEGGNEIPKVLSAKQNLETFENLIKGFGSVAITLPGHGVFPCGLQTLPYHLRNMHNLASKIRENTTLQTLLTVKQTEN